MADRPEKAELLAKLVRHVAAGGKILAFCRRHEVASRTAYRWSKTPRFQARVEELRRRASDRAIGLLAKHATTAVEGMAKLAKSAESEPTKLSAQRGILAELRDMTGFTTLERRMAAIEERLKAKESSP
jgi:hypothetical protein